MLFYHSLTTCCITTLLIIVIVPTTVIKPWTCSLFQHAWTSLSATIFKLACTTMFKLASSTMFKPVNMKNQAVRFCMCTVCFRESRVYIYMFRGNCVRAGGLCHQAQFSHIYDPDCIFNRLFTASLSIYGTSIACWSCSTDSYSTRDSNRSKPMLGPQNQRRGRFDLSDKNSLCVAEGMVSC